MLFKCTHAVADTQSSRIGMLDTIERVRFLLFPPPELPQGYHRAARKNCPRTVAISAQRVRFASLGWARTSLWGQRRGNTGLSGASAVEGVSGAFRERRQRARASTRRDRYTPSTPAPSIRAYRNAGAYTCSTCVLRWPAPCVRVVHANACTFERFVFYCS